MSYWWVNHKQTSRQEINGGYVWSPKQESNGNRSQYYDYMHEMRPNDLIVSYAYGEVGHYGVVSSFPVSAPKPSEFGHTGRNWSSDGWLVGIAWKKLPQAFRPKDHMAIIGQLLPERYSPLQISGKGNQKAYLTRIDRALFLELQKIGNFEANISNQTDSAFELIEKIETQIEDDLRKLPIDITEIDAVIKARKGQGKFRRNVEQLESRCRITGLADKRLLIASHIKPWRVCETAAERLDGANGLLLAPHIDRLFDLGLLTFTQTGGMILSGTLKRETIECLGLHRSIIEGVNPFMDVQENYLTYHREYVFIA